MESRVSLSTPQVADAALHTAFRVARLAHWTLFLMAHLALWCLVLTMLWLTQASPSAIASAFHRWLATSPAQTLSALGLSGLTVAALWWRAAKWIAYRTRHGWLKRYLTDGLF